MIVCHCSVQETNVFSNTKIRYEREGLVAQNEENILNSMNIRDQQRNQFMDVVDAIFDNFLWIPYNLSRVVYNRAK